MAQIFPHALNPAAKLSVIGSLLVGAAITWICLTYTGTAGMAEGQTPVQPVPFSHEHHVGILGIDCRHCHDIVERSSFAGIPPTKTCMNCHSQIWVGSQMLEPVRASYRTDQSLQWKRVYNLPGFVYFNHRIHIHKGIGCSSCHGRLDRMPFTYQFPQLSMHWCLNCHRNPAQQIRPRESVFDIAYEPPDDQSALGEKLVKEYGVRDTRFLTSCSVCHR